MPVGIGRRPAAGIIEQGDVLGIERPAHRAEILSKLLLVACADNDVGDGRAGEQPCERDLADGLPCVGRDLVERVDDMEQVILVDMRPPSAPPRAMRPSAGARPRRILPVKRPQPSGLHTMEPTP